MIDGDVQPPQCLVGSTHRTGQCDCSFMLSVPTIHYLCRHGFDDEDITENDDDDGQTESHDEHPIVEDDVRPGSAVHVEATRHEQALQTVPAERAQTALSRQRNVTSTRTSKTV